MILACFVTHSRLAPRSHWARMADWALALAAAVRMVAGVHGGAANSWTPAHVTLTTGFAEVYVFMVDVAYLTDCCDAVHRNVAHFS